MTVPQYVYRVNAVTGVLERHPSMGEGVNWFSDGNSRPAPASPVFAVQNSLPTIPPEKIGRGIEFTGPNGQDPNPDRQLQVQRGQARKIRELQAQAYVNSE